jgi:hypothetical protein
LNVLSLSVLYYVLYVPFSSSGLPSIILFVKCSCTCLQPVILPFFPLGWLLSLSSWLTYLFSSWSRIPCTPPWVHTVVSYPTDFLSAKVRIRQFHNFMERLVVPSNVPLHCVRQISLHSFSPSCMHCAHCILQTWPFLPRIVFGEKQIFMFVVYLTATLFGCACSPYRLYVCGAVRSLFSWCVERFTRLDWVTRGFCEKRVLINILCE